MTLLEQHARQRPSAPALRSPHELLSYRELYARARRCAAALQERGVREGGIVCTLGGNSIDHAVTLHALWLLGTVACPLNTRLGSAELRRQVEQLHPAALISDMVGHDAPPCPLIPMGDPDGGGDERAFIARQQGDDALCSVLFTSGTTGQARAVPQRWRHHRASAHANRSLLGVEEDDDWLCVIPLFHIGGLAIVLRSLLYGTTCTLLDGFSESDVLRQLRTGEVTLLSLVPTMLHRLLAAMERGRGEAESGSMNAPGLRAVLLGGGPTGEELLERASAAGIPTLATYGLTESCSQIATMPPEYAHTRPLSSGRVLQGATLCIRDETGGECEPGVVGEIVIAGAMVVDGYTDGSARERFAGGMFRTGDLGHLDADGFLYVHMRREDRVVSGGENVSPHEVEDVLLRHPQVREAAVFGTADEEWGQVVTAAVVLSADVSTGTLEEHCRSLLAPFKCPRRWLLLEELPRTASGKLRRGELRDRFGGQATVPT